MIEVVTASQKSALFWCEGCKLFHGINFVGWTWNGDKVKPTFTPSVLVEASDGVKRCHSWIKDGEMCFLNDCDHDFKNQTKPLIPIDEAWIRYQSE